MEILYFEDLAANTVVLVIGDYKISIATYLRGSTGGRDGVDAKTIISPNTSFGDIIIVNKVQTSKT